ncbi:MAG: peptide deformylase [Acutalibacteraceae bacterium]|nr:peptide deformylase [Clostridia bacterium]MEE1143799.1 peptide deformylase [Acutalibacteraceae bacterium]
MAIREIVKKGDSVLNKVCRPVEKFDSKLHKLLDDMAETMHEANGAGLAAPQVAILRRICIVDIGDEDGVIELINPKIIAKSGMQRTEEGCLSCPGIWGYTERPMYVTVRAFDRFGNQFEKSAEGLKAKAFCHEIDHLDGILFTQKVVEFIDAE